MKVEFCNYFVLLEMSVILIRDHYALKSCLFLQNSLKYIQFVDNTCILRDRSQLIMYRRLLLVTAKVEIKAFLNTRRVWWY